MSDETAPEKTVADAPGYLRANSSEAPESGATESGETDSPQVNEEEAAEDSESTALGFISELPKKPFLIVGIASVLVVIVAVAWVLMNRHIAVQRASWTPSTEPTRTTSSQVTQGAEGEVLVRDFGGPAAAIGSTVELKDRDDNGETVATVQIDQANWEDNDGSASVRSYSFLALHVNITCKTEKCYLSEYDFNFIGSDSGVYISTHEGLEKYSERLEEVDLGQDASYSGWLIIEATKQAGTLIVNPLSPSSPSARFAIDGPPATDLRTLDNQLDASDASLAYNDIEIHITSYQVIEASDALHKGDQRLLVARVKLISQRDATASVPSHHIRALQNGEQVDDKYQTDEYGFYPWFPGARVESGDTVEGFVAFWITPGQPVTIVHHQGDDADVEIVTIQT